MSEPYITCVSVLLVGGGVFTHMDLMLRPRYSLKLESDRNMASNEDHVSFEIFKKLT